MGKDPRTDASSAADGSGGELQVVVSSDPEALALAVASAVAVEAQRAVKRSGCFNLALSGGSTPALTYRLLAGSPFAEDIPWSATHLFWSDERCVDATDPYSNEGMARRALLDHVAVPRAQVHPMCCSRLVEDSGGDERLTALRAREAAEGYEKLLRTRGQAMDLVLLGLGEDGHTASLFPDSDALEDGGRWVLPVLHEPKGAHAVGREEPLWRVTLTASFINQAAAIFFIVSGRTKAGVVREVIRGAEGADQERALRLPAQSIRPRGGRLCWFLDAEAAAELDRGRPR